jgi:hypothetical protein
MFRFCATIGFDITTIAPDDFNARVGATCNVTRIPIRNRIYFLVKFLRIIAEKYFHRKKQPKS